MPVASRRKLSTVVPLEGSQSLIVPSVLAVGGSWLVAPELVREGRFDEVERLARETVELAT